MLKSLINLRYYNKPVWVIIYDNEWLHPVSLEKFIFVAAIFDVFIVIPANSNNSNYFEPLAEQLLNTIKYNRSDLLVFPKQECYFNEKKAIREYNKLL